MCAHQRREATNKNWFVESSEYVRNRSFSFAPHLIQAMSVDFNGDGAWRPAKRMQRSTAELPVTIRSVNFQSKFPYQITKLSASKFDLSSTSLDRFVSFGIEVKIKYFSLKIKEFGIFFLFLAEKCDNLFANRLFVFLLHVKLTAVTQRRNLLSEISSE